MKKFGAPEQLSDFSDFSRSQQLREALQDQPEPLRLLRTSPDGQHLLLLLAAERRLLSFDRLPRATLCLQAPGCLDRRWPPLQLPIAGLLFVEAGGGAGGGAVRPRDSPWALVIVWESGRAEVWRYGQTAAGGWGQLQTLELCSSARARVASVCCQARSIVWCEERPPSEVSLAAAAARASGFRYCVCRRTLAVQDRDVTLGPVNIVLHHCPQYRLLASPCDVFLVPAATAVSSWGGLSKLLLVWSPRDERVTIAAPSRGFVHSTSLAPGESDFKKLLSECAGLLPSIEATDIQSFSLSHCGRLLLIGKQGAVDLLHGTGAVRRVYDFGGLSLAAEEEVQMQIYGDTLACVLDRILYLIDVNTGRLMEKTILNTEEILFMDPLKEDDIQIITKSGIYNIGLSSDGAGTQGDHRKSEPALVEMIFEEACKYYQRRSLSNTKLTVDNLKRGGMFQAPIALASILQSCTKEKNAKNRLQEPYTNLLSTLSSELQSYLSLELLKSQIIEASERVSQQYCEDLVDQEINRLLNSDVDRENLIYINTIFNTFPKAAWKSIKRNLQLQWNGDGKLVARAVPDVWKKILGPFTSMSQDTTLNGVLPLFELICRSLHKFKPMWLPSFVAELTHQQISFSWNYGSKESSENVPLYKRALSILTKRSDNTTVDNDVDLEIELLLCSERPKAIMQAVNILINSRQWERVIEAAQKHSKLSPVVNKDIFITLLTQFAQHRELDPYLGKLWEICPRDMTVTTILNIVLQHVPKSEEDSNPFPSNSENQLTVGLLKPLLNRVLQYHSKSDEIYVDIVQASSFPPPTPPREQRPIIKVNSDPAFHTVGQHELIQRTTSLSNMK